MLKQLSIGAAGIVGTSLSDTVVNHVTPVVAAVDPSTIQTVGDLILKIVITIVTVWGLLKRKKPTVE